MHNSFINVETVEKPPQNPLITIVMPIYKVVDDSFKFAVNMAAIITAMKLHKNVPNGKCFEFNLLKWYLNNAPNGPNNAAIMMFHFKNTI